MLTEIITKLGAPQYIVTHGFGFVTSDVIITASPIRLYFNVEGTPVIIPGNVVHADAIRLLIELRGAAIGTDIFILDFEAHCNFIPAFQANITTNLTFLTPVELEEEVIRIRIT